MAALALLLLVLLMFTSVAMLRWQTRRRYRRGAATPPFSAQDPGAQDPDVQDPDAPEPGAPVPLTVDRADAGTGPESTEGRLVCWLLDGELTAAAYREAMTKLAIEDDLRHPMAVPPDNSGAAD